MSYRGRFAPSPTGPLHLGSLLAAAASYLDARRSGGEWLVRMEDIDPPREMPGAAADILRALERLNLFWDGSVLYQSTRHQNYHGVIEGLLEQGLAFRCSCSRRAIREHAGSGPTAARYPGTCRNVVAHRGPTAIRALTNKVPVEFADRLQGHHCVDLEHTSGDYIVQRRDGLPAYHLAVVLDDAEQGITDVVRGCDLLESTAVHCHLQSLLGLSRPRYGHIPLLVNTRGDKMSKQTGAAALDLRHPNKVISQALAFLGCTPPPALQCESPAVLWQWAIEEFRMETLAGQAHIGPN